jgi:hypothetical protein
MYAPYEQAANSRSLIMKILVRRFVYRAPKFWVGVALVSALLAIPVGLFLCAHGWLGYGLPLLAVGTYHILIAHRVASATYLAEARRAAHTS